MRISEIFHSIQGEGGLTGVPSVFVRVSGCNLRCRWCDTPYASWHPEGPEMSAAEVLDAVLAFPSRHVVLTGGEPMLAKDLPDLAAALRAHGRYITIETAATLPPEGIACDLASLSPKLADSTPSPADIAPGWVDRHEARRLRPDVLRAWISAYDYQLKFVVSRPGDLDEITAVISGIGLSVPPEKILLMPEGRAPEAVDRRAVWLAEICKERGFRFCDRLHLRLYGDTRGT